MSFNSLGKLAVFKKFRVKEICLESALDLKIKLGLILQEIKGATSVKRATELLETVVNAGKAVLGKCSFGTKGETKN